MTELEKRAKVRVVVLNVVKVVTLLGLLYIFVCSLDLLASAFRLLAARQAGAYNGTFDSWRGFQEIHASLRFQYIQHRQHSATVK